MRYTNAPSRARALANGVVERTSTIALTVTILLGATLALPVPHAHAHPNPGLPPPTEAIELGTPRDAVQTFLKFAQQGDWINAARALDLRHLTRAAQRELGPDYARALAEVLITRGVILEAIPDDEDPGQRTISVLDIVENDGQNIEVRRVLAENAQVWVFARESVQMAPDLEADIDRGPIGNRLPRSLWAPRTWGLEPWQWIGVLALLMLGFLSAMMARRGYTFLANTILRAWAPSSEARSAVELANRPVTVALALSVIGSLGFLLSLPPSPHRAFGTAYFTFWLMWTGWTLARIADFAAKLIADRAVAGQGHWRSRGVRTRMMMLRRVLQGTVSVILCAIFLMQFQAVREIGLSLLASAGVAGLVVGVAAQRTIGNLLAGMQLSLTQPLRMGDKVSFEGEFGTVAEINLTYVVLELWDETSLVIPMSKLLESTFRNYDRTDGALLGPVLLQVDFETPFDTLRSAVEAYIKDHPLHDGRVARMQVTETDERTATIRVLASAQDASAVWDLRCDVREWLITYLRELEGGRFLPSLRVRDVIAAREHELDVAAES